MAAPGSNPLPYFRPNSHLVWAAKRRVVRTATVDDVIQQCLLTVVGCKDGYAGGRVPQQPHVLVDRHQVLGLTQVLVEVRDGLAFATALEVRHIHQLVVEGESRVATHERLPRVSQRVSDTAIKNE